MNFLAREEVKRGIEEGEEEREGVKIRRDAANSHTKVDREWGSNGIGR